jgi:hypothetical protein
MFGHCLTLMNNFYLNRLVLHITTSKLVCMMNYRAQPTRFVLHDTSGANIFVGLLIKSFYTYINMSHAAKISYSIPRVVGGL